MKTQLLLIGWCLIAYQLQSQNCQNGTHTDLTPGLAPGNGGATPNCQVFINTLVKLDNHQEHLTWNIAISIRDITGKEVFTSMEKSSNEILLNIPPLYEGLYILKLINININ